MKVISMYHGSSTEFRVCIQILLQSIWEFVVLVCACVCAFFFLIKSEKLCVLCFCCHSMCFNLKIISNILYDIKASRKCYAYFHCITLKLRKLFFVVT